MATIPRPLIIVHPDFPWSGAGFVTEYYRSDICLPVLALIVAAARRRRASRALVIVMAVVPPGEWRGPDPAEMLLSELASLATHTAPDGFGAARSGQWLQQIRLPGPAVIAGFWRDRCVSEVARAWPSTISKRLSVLSP